MDLGYTTAQLRAAAADAVRAPSLHNTQPWRLRLRDGGIEVLADPARRLPATDPSGWGVRIACGAALFNLRVALAVAGVPARVRLRPDPAEPDLLARLVPDIPRRPTPAEQSLHAAIPRRFSNRLPFWPDPVPSDARWRIGEAARAEGCWLEFLIGVSAVTAFGEIARSAHRVLERDPAYRAERERWLRHERAPDGVPAAAGGPQHEPQDVLPTRGFGGRDRAPGRDFEPEPLVGVLGSVGNTAVDQVVAGQALQRVLLTATDSGLSVSMLSQPIEVPTAREQLRVSLGRFGAPQMVLRIGYGQPGRPTPRRDVDEVLTSPTAGSVAAYLPRVGE
ncbi:Acg family FMN-binding oxidoreductase [Micromonospora sp. NPDC047557]|uniref:Acg family FMN-binding oxidoreductase n=1 Tax=Micromonospora sp. NPDC047557 TaxID=3364250 RepID=UPI00371CED57